MTTGILDQLRDGVDFIESHLHEPLDLRSVSRAATMSPRSFQRTFKAVTGDTVKAYIRARRLSHALDLLESTGPSILDVAVAAGYETQESFAKVFRASMGMTPSQYRKGQRARQRLRKVRIDEAYLNHLGHGMLSPEPVIQEQDALTLLGVRTRYDGEERQLNTLGQSLDELWSHLLSVVDSIPDRVEAPFYGVVQDGVEDDTGLDYLAAVVSTATDTPPGLVSATVPAGRWAVFAHHGNPAEIDHTVNYVYGSWLVRSDKQHSGGPDIEIYGDRWVYGSPESVMHYAIPLA